jgi:hypothetical protein
MIFRFFLNVMLKRMHVIVTYLIIALGVVHLLFTVRNFSRFTLGALWFASAGFAIIFAGFLNVVLIRGAGRDRVVRALCLTTNIMVTALFGAALYVLREPQVLIGLLLFALASLAALKRGTA